MIFGRFRLKGFSGYWTSKRLKLEFFRTSDQNRLDSFSPMNYKSTDGVNNRTLIQNPRVRKKFPVRTEIDSLYLEATETELMVF